MYRRIFSVIILVVLLFSLCACNKNEAPKDTPVTEPSEITPIAKDEPKEAPVKEFSDGRIYTEGDIVSFAETENYYFILDVQDGFKYISCFTKDGKLIKRAKPMGEKGGKEIYFYPETDIYPVKNDCVIFCCISENISKCIIADKNIETTVITTDNIPNLRTFRAAFLNNGEGYYDILTLDVNGLLYRFNEDRMTTVQNGEYFSFSDLSPRHYSDPKTAFRTEDGSVYTCGRIAEPFYDEYFQDKVVIAKFSDSGEMLASKVCSFGYDSIMEAKSVGNYIVFAQAVFDWKTATYTNRLFVLDKNLNEVFVKDYTGELPVEVVAVGDKLAVSLYVADGSKHSSVQILDEFGNESARIAPLLMYSRLHSDNNGGFYITGKQGKNFDSPVNTVIRRYNESLELTEEILYETKSDPDNGFGMFVEINSEGEPIALQGKISSFPIRAIDKSEPGDEYYYYENTFTGTIDFKHPSSGSLPVDAENNRLNFNGSAVNSLSVNNRHYVLSHVDGPNVKYLSCFDSNGKRLWEIEITIAWDLYYIDGRIMTLAGDGLDAYDAETGECLWSMSIGGEGQTVGSTLIDNMLYVIRFNGEQYCYCTVNASGEWEFLPFPKQGFGLMVSDCFKADPSTGEFYCLFSDDEKTTVAKLNERMEITAHYTLEGVKNIGYFDFKVNNGMVYVSEKYEPFNEQTQNTYILDGELNLLNVLKDYYLPGALDEAGIIAYSYRDNGTFAMNKYGNILKKLAGAEYIRNAFVTDTGIATVCQINDSSFKVYDYDSSFKLNNITVYKKTGVGACAYLHNGKIIIH